MLNLTVNGGWMKVFTGSSRTALEESLIGYVQNQRWFGGKARQIKTASFQNIVPVPYDSEQAAMTQILIEYTEEDPETYVLPLGFASGDRAEKICKANPKSVLATLSVREKNKEQTGCLYDAIFDKAFCKALLQMIAKRRHLRGQTGDFVAAPVRAMLNGQLTSLANLEVASMRAEQSNSSVVFGDRLILKLIRKSEPGINPDLEVGQFLTEQVGFPHSPSVAGSIEFRPKKGQVATVGILQKFVPNEGDAWRHTLAALSLYSDRAVTRPADEWKDFAQRQPFVEQVQTATLPPLSRELVGPFLENVKLLGQRTAELHVALASDTEHPDFAPEPFSVLYQRSLYQAMRNHSGQMLQLLKNNIQSLRGIVLDEATKVLERNDEILGQFRSLLSNKIVAKRTRIHGDYHLGQVLYTGKDYVIIDFEGEPARPLTERRIKRSPIRDVAGMLRSFHYAAYTLLFGQVGSANVRPEDLPALEPWARIWNVWICSAFLASYREHAAPGGFLPASPEEFNILLNTYLLDKVLYELGYELNNRPDWVRIPLAGLLQLLQTPETSA